MRPKRATVSGYLEDNDSVGLFYGRNIIPPACLSAQEVLQELKTKGKGWHVIRPVRLETIIVLQGAGLIKAQAVGNAVACFQARLTKDGREWLV